ncbi:MAG: sugar ABC transporter permease [Paracoccus sp. (in: a-proteobacteria)]|jgi:D-xylose transport system permease protein|uniref:sugar ABC transporter permease n=1 Tax=unclassified Paracoccus (in: a-proteobacteria) TaxID=2688777 RepID=UPI000C4EE357|nr:MULTISPECIES: sugar ABC transporter permease [unclassified Paracoccus (in: a-proteobacteria)]MAN54901.1 sugar ABC transporter permease [Paracoccus sp. (in: a-proteobacteria)]MBA50236.1 sugar ABC transporter permease [Paracoccus sp. (in: a-proteobacteria)]MCS5603211.1 sugar ABC transporter permease [Paracoccus sp. (in: a-proteobacteria)]HIC67024.1 sugar ABC transporter permease [Paracoccus sp. (in: a-proteobacteria)]|tara:strand:+ start:5338 stop:6636 length:1299 start_codon:yes stop_codon:yes gene_type:complete
MADSATSQSAPPARKGFAALELDTRLLGMIGAFILIALAFHLASGGRFITPRNLFNLTIQTASVAIMATGMVFIIVDRHIDLSVGSILATASAVMAVTQTEVMPNWLGLGLNHPATAWVAIAVGIITGGAIGAFQGWLVGYLTIPAFIVTLGGLLVWRNVAWYITSGQTIGPLDSTFQLFGGINGTLGQTGSWILAIAASVAAVWALWSARRNKITHEFHVKPLWAEAAVGAIIVVAIMGFVAIMNAYTIPSRLLERRFEARGEVMPEGLTQGYGVPISVVLLIAVAIVMTIIARRTRFGRYIFATGGNPDAAELSGINTRLLTVKIFTLLGVLCAISAVVASSRLTYHSNDIGVLDELRVIAAAVIGGTALKGGVGTIYGAIIGALIMQSLQSGMAMVGVDAPLQNIVVGAVLVAAVLIDIWYRRRIGSQD